MNAMLPELRSSNSLGSWRATGRLVESCAITDDETVALRSVARVTRANDIARPLSGRMRARDTRHVLGRSLPESQDVGGRRFVSSPGMPFVNSTRIRRCSSFVVTVACGRFGSASSLFTDDI